MSQFSFLINPRNGEETAYGRMLLRYMLHALFGIKQVHMVREVHMLEVLLLSVHQLQVKGGPITELFLTPLIGSTFLPYGFIEHRPQFSEEKRWVMAPEMLQLIWTLLELSSLLAPMTGADIHIHEGRILTLSDHYRKQLIEQGLTEPTVIDGLMEALKQRTEMVLAIR